MPDNKMTDNKIKDDERFHIKITNITYNETKLIYYDALNEIPLQYFNHYIDCAVIETITDTYITFAISNKNQILTKIDILDQMLECDIKQKYDGIIFNKTLIRNIQYPALIKVLYNKDYLKRSRLEEQTIVKNINIELLSIKKKYSKFTPTWSLVSMDKYKDKTFSKTHSNIVKKNIDKIDKTKIFLGIGSIPLDKIQQQLTKLKPVL